MIISVRIVTCWQGSIHESRIFTEFRHQYSSSRQRLSGSSKLLPRHLLALIVIKVTL